MECLKLAPTDCSNDPHGPIGTWGVSAVTDMSKLFVDINENAVPEANTFNGDLSKWDVSRVTNMEEMLYGASSFAQTLCGDAWLTSTANKHAMFAGSSGQICKNGKQDSIHDENPSPDSD